MEPLLGIASVIQYEDAYVQPLIVSALKNKLPIGLLTFADDPGSAPGPKPLLQIRAYESLDFETVLSEPRSLMNAYVIRKALIRKHYLSHTISSHLVKHPGSDLKRHFKPAVDFELDYAEFLDEALVEAFELQEAFQRNDGKAPEEREWWILKPGMSDRGQGIRLFSTEDELRGIFEQWEANDPDSDDEPIEDDSQSTGDDAGPKPGNDYIVTSHLRHFIAQPYIHPPFLIPQEPFSNRKFHIRTYIVAAGALRVYVYQHMLALFASEPYTPPWTTTADGADEFEEALLRMRNIHLTNTCVQTAHQLEDGTHPTNSVHLLADLPLKPAQLAAIQEQINNITSDLFKAALAHPTHFQPIPQSFEIFGLDFLVTPSSELPSDGVNSWLLEVNAFPDFAQTGPRLRDVVVQGLWNEVATCVIGPHFGIHPELASGSDSLHKVLDVDTGRK